MAEARSAQLPATDRRRSGLASDRRHPRLYPLMPSDVSRLVVADFDGQAALLDALAYLKAARSVDMPASLEVSPSGTGAHVWIFSAAMYPPQLPAGSVPVCSAKPTRHNRLHRVGNTRAGRGPVGIPIQPRPGHPSACGGPRDCDASTSRRTGCPATLAARIHTYRPTCARADPRAARRRSRHRTRCHHNKQHMIRWRPTSRASSWPHRAQAKQ